MILNAVSNIVLALVLAYLLLSLLATVINEFISSTLKLRANNLFGAIKALIDDKNIRALFYDSGLIKSTDTSAADKDAIAKPSYIDGKTFASGLLNALGQGGALFDLDSLKTKIDGLGGNLLKDALKSIIATSIVDASEGKFLKVHNGIATWFDNSMERLTGDYVRMMKWISLVVGVVLAFSLNVDTIRIGYYVGSHPEIAATLDGLGKEVAKAYPNGNVPDCKSDDPATSLPCRLKQANDLKAQLEKLPIGWDGDLPNGDLLTWLLLKFFGLLLTGLAVSIGSPFWFDILQRVMSFRGAGTKASSANDKSP